jgi:uncharacterized protein (DUF1778 family)
VIISTLYGDLPYNRTVSTTRKTDRLDLRLTSSQKREIEEAAAITGRSVTDFSVSAIVERAEDTIRREREIAMSAQSFEAFSAVLDRPATAIDGLAELLRRPSVFID